VDYRSRLGTTVTLALDNAPFPAKGARYKDNTVIVFVPWYYNLNRYRDINAVVFFHGHSNTASGAMRHHQIREQLVDSKQNAILICPQGPVRAKDSSGGKLSQRGGLERLLKEVRTVLGHGRNRSRLGRAFIPPVRKRRRITHRRISKVILAAHSGGFAVTAHIVRGRRQRKGGHEISEIFLFDALYGSIPAFADWVYGSRRRRLVSFYAGGRPTKRNKELIRRLEERGIPARHEKKEGTLSCNDWMNGRAIFVNTATSHSGSSHRYNQLRDSLYTSTLRRHLKTRFFRCKNFKNRRIIEKR